MYMYINKSIKSWRHANKICRFSKKVYLHLRVDISGKWNHIKCFFLRLYTAPQTANNPIIFQVTGRFSG
jgi:hypothetical protein